MAGFIESLAKPSTEMSSTRALREVARKLVELEETEDRTAVAVDDVKKLQKSLSAKIDELERSMKAETGRTVEAVPAADLSETERKVSDLKADLGEIKAAMVILNDRLEEMSRDVNEGMDDNTRRLEIIAEQLEKEEEVVKEEPQNNEEVLDMLENMKLSIEDTIHKENIKCFRNIQGALEEESDGKNYDVSGLKKYVRLTIWFQLVTIAIVVLHILGMI